MDLWVHVFGVIIILTVISIVIVPEFSYEEDCCSICGSYYALSDLEDGKDIDWDYCGGLGIALDELWTTYNNGGGSARSQYHLEYLEKIRVEFYPESGLQSFDLITLSNPCPQSPNLKYIGTGVVYDYIPWSYDGPAYSIVKIRFNDSNITVNNCGADIGEVVYVFKQKHHAWHWQFKEAKLFNVSKYPDKPDLVNDAWVKWTLDYQMYLDCSGVDVGDQYWM